MDHCGLGFSVQDFVLLFFVSGKQEQAAVRIREESLLIKVSILCENY